jgi:hypothetical protein
MQLHLLRHQASDVVATGATHFGQSPQSSN